MEVSIFLYPYPRYDPNKGKIDGKKVLLKKLLKSNLPKSPIENMKKGFSVSFINWLRRDLSKPFKDVLLDNDSIHYFGMNRSHIEKVFNDQYNARYDYKRALFTLFLLFNWKKSLSR